MNKNWFKISLIYLLTIALLGVILRYLFIGAIPGINYKNLLHAHSHAALLGWLYSSFFVAFVHAFLNEKDKIKKVYKVLFWLTQLAVLGMLISFPFQGYGAVSITFSTAHILLSYWFMYRFLKDVGSNGLKSEKNVVAFRFVKWSLIFMAISSIGPWSLGPIMAQGLGGSHFYYLAIYFYLHFQYNGWFTLALFGLFFWWLDQRNIPYSRKDAHTFFVLITFSCIPAFALSALWTQPSLWVYIVGGISAIIQMIALGLLIKILVRCWSDLQKLINPFIKFVLLLSLISFCVKIILQVASAFPLIADLAYKIRNFIIGYLHLTLIGFISLFILAFFHLIGLLDLSNNKSKTGLSIFLVGFFLSEILIFLQGYFFWTLLGEIPYYYHLLFSISLLMPAGIAILILAQKKQCLASSISSID